MAYPIYQGLSTAARYLLTGNAHFMLIGDSQFSGSFLRVPNHILHYLPRRLHYCAADPQQFGNQCLTNHLPSESGNFSGVSSTGVDPNTLYTGHTLAGTLFRAARAQVHAANHADATSFGSGIYLCRKCQGGGDANSPGSTGGQWPDVNVTSGSATFDVNTTLVGYRPWFHNTWMKAKLIVHRVTEATELTTFDYAMLRQGVSNNNTSAYTTASLTGTIVKETAFTPALTDRTDYHGAATFPNDHEVAVRIRATTGHDETGKVIIPLTAIFARCSSAGVIPWDAAADGSTYGFGFDSIGIAGRSAYELANTIQPSATWQEYLLRTILNPSAVFVPMIMLGHNNPNEYDSGSNATDAAGDFEDYVNKIKTAFLASFPTGVFAPILCTPWLSLVESNKYQTLAKARAHTEAVRAMAAANGWGFISLLDYFGEAQPFNQLHPESIGEVHRVCRAFRDVLDRATGFRYTTAGGVGALRPRGRG